MKSDNILREIKKKVLEDFCVVIDHLNPERIIELKSYLDKQTYNYVVTKRAEDNEESRKD